MQIRDWYISVLEKRAAEEEPMGVDNQEAAVEGLKDNQDEQKKDLSELFTRTGESEKKETAIVRKTFPSVKKKEDTTTSSTLLKVAANKAFFRGVRYTELLKTAGPEYIRTAYYGFNDELDKIASLLAGTGTSATKSISKHLKSPFPQLAKSPAVKTVKAPIPAR